MGTSTRVPKSHDITDRIIHREHIKTLHSTEL